MPWMMSLLSSISISIFSERVLMASVRLMSLPAPCDELMNDSGQPSPSTMYKLVPWEPGKRRYYITMPAWWREGRIAVIFDESEIDSWLTCCLLLYWPRFCNRRMVSHALHVSRYIDDCTNWPLEDVRLRVKSLFFQYLIWLKFICESISLWRNATIIWNVV